MFLTDFLGTRSRAIAVPRRGRLCTQPRSNRQPATAATPSGYPSVCRLSQVTGVIDGIEQPLGDQGIVGRRSWDPRCRAGDPGGADGRRGRSVADHDEIKARYRVA